MAEADADQSQEAHQHEADERFMAAALNLSRWSLGLAAPNPSVGALVVKNGTIIGRGVTGQGGRPHGEVIALEQAGAAARGATLYVTLEPCSHHGRTPPCADAIIAAGIARVVSAIEDPNPKVAGEGHSRLRAAGIEVVTGIREEAARRLHLGHILAVTANRPMITLKLAETADGYAADPPGAPRLMITGETANGFVQMQRAMHDAILVGSGTAVADDPQLTVRLPGLETRKPLRIVLDTNLRLAADARLAETARDVPVLVIAGEDAPDEKIAALTGKAVEVVCLPRDGAGHVDLHKALAYLSGRGITRVFCEGGPTLAASLIKGAFADEILRLQSATPLGHAGQQALGEEASLMRVLFYDFVETRILGVDRLLRYERKM